MCNWMVTFTTNSFLQPILCVKMPSHALGAICWTFVARRILALSTGEQNTGSVPVGGPPVTGPSPTGSGPGSARKTQALVAGWSSCPCGSGAMKGGGDDTKQILALSSLDDHQESQSRLPRLVPMVGWLHILGTLKDLRSETNEAVPNHHSASAGWCDRLDCCIVSSASDTAIALEGQGWTHTRPTQSLQRNAAFFCDSSQKKK